MNGSPPGTDLAKLLPALIQYIERDRFRDYPLGGAVTPERQRELADRRALEADMQLRDQVEGRVNEYRQNLVEFSMDLDALRAKYAHDPYISEVLKERSMGGVFTSPEAQAQQWASNQFSAQEAGSWLESLSSFLRNTVENNPNMRDTRYALMSMEGGYEPRVNRSLLHDTRKWKERRSEKSAESARRLKERKRLRTEAEEAEKEADSLKVEAEKAEEKKDKVIDLIIGKRLADFILRRGR